MAKAGLLTSSEVELMETGSIKHYSLPNRLLLTSSEVELMETGEASSVSSSFFFF